MYHLSDSLVKTVKVTNGPTRLIALKLDLVYN